MAACPIVLCAARGGAGAAWADDDTIVFGGGPGGGLARVSSRGGDPVGDPWCWRRRRRPPASSVSDGPTCFPVIAASSSPSSRSTAATSPCSIDGGRRTVLATGAAFGRYAPTGHLVFERQGRLEAARFSLASLATTEAARPAVSGVSRGAMLDGPQFAFSRTGSLVYVPSDPAERDAPLHWLDAAEQLADGHTVSPTWRPDGLEIAFAFSKAGPFNLFVKPVDGQAAAPLLPSEWNQFPTSWAPDARYLAFTEFQPMTGADIWVIDLQTRRATRDGAHVVRRNLGAFFARRKVDRLHVERVRSMGSLRSARIRPRTARARLEAKAASGRAGRRTARRSTSAPVAGRWRRR